MRKVRVAIIGTRGYPSYYGGFETAVRKIVESEHSNSLDFVVFSRETDCVRDPLQKNVRVVYSRFIKTKYLSTLSHIFLSMNALRKVKPDVVLGFNVSCGYVAPILRIMGIPLILNVDGLEWKRGKWGRIGKLVFFCGAWLSAKFADILVADSTNIASYWRLNFRRECCFIPYGGEEVVSKSGLNNERPYILYVARFVPENHVLEFLEAIQWIDSSVDICVVGKSHSAEYAAEQLEGLVIRDSRVKDLGRIINEDDLNQYWANSLVYFHGHSVGGTNPALVQAMASGCNIVAFDSVFNREVLGDSALFTRSAPKAIAQEINNLISNSKLRKQLSESAILRAKEMYTWDQIVKQYSA